MDIVKEILIQIISKGIPTVNMPDEEIAKKIREADLDVETLYKIALLATLSRIELLLALSMMSKKSSGVDLEDIIKRLSEE